MSHSGGKILLNRVIYFFKK